MRCLVQRLQRDEATAGEDCAIDIVLRKEQPILTAARAPGFTVDKLRAAWAEADAIK